jgi:hypothetical protein
MGKERHSIGDVSKRTGIPYEQVAEGIPIDKQWMRAMTEASAPKLPDEPTG